MRSPFQMYSGYLKTSSSVRSSSPTFLFPVRKNHVRYTTPGSDTVRAAWRHPRRMRTARPATVTIVTLTPENMSPTMDTTQPAMSRAPQRPSWFTSSRTAMPRATEPMKPIWKAHSRFS